MIEFAFSDQSFFPFLRLYHIERSRQRRVFKAEYSHTLSYETLTIPSFPPYYFIPFQSPSCIADSIPNLARSSQSPFRSKSPSHSQIQSHSQSHAHSQTHSLALHQHIRTLNPIFPRSHAPIPTLTSPTQFTLYVYTPSPLLNSHSTSTLRVSEFPLSKPSSQIRVQSPCPKVRVRSPNESSLSERIYLNKVLSSYLTFMQCVCNC